MIHSTFNFSGSFPNMAALKGGKGGCPLVEECPSDAKIFSEKFLLGQ